MNTIEKNAEIDDNFNKISQCIINLSRKASLLIKARKMGLSKSQMNVYRKVVNNQITMTKEWRSIDSLIRKGLIEKKDSYSYLECHYKTTH